MKHKIKLILANICLFIPALVVLGLRLVKLLGY